MLIAHVIELGEFNPRARPSHGDEGMPPRLGRQPNVKLVPLSAQTESTKTRHTFDKNTTFGQRRAAAKPKLKAQPEPAVSRTPLEGMEMSWVPSPTMGPRGEGSTASRGRGNKGRSRKGVEMFGAGMERGGEEMHVDESRRKGRTQRRTGIRSGSKSAFRRMGVRS